MCIFQKTSLPGTEVIHSHIASPNFCIVVMALAALAHILCLELPVYILFALTAIYICLFDQDLLGLMPVMVACYITPSATNNPGRNPQSVFSGGEGAVLGVLAVCMALALLFRIIRDRKRFFQKPGKCFLGLVALCAAYFLSGIGSVAYPQYLKNNLLFALMQSACLFLPYWLFSRGVDWKNTQRDYFAWMCFAAGGVLAMEIFWSYCTQNVIFDGVIIRERMFTGWGMYNNMGFLLAFMLPSAFYLASKYRRGWLGTVVGSMYLICIFLTCSRSSIIGGCVIYAVCVVIMLRYAKNKKHNFIAWAVVCALVMILLIAFHRQIFRLFSRLIAKGTDPSSRDSIYVEGLRLFAQSPLFGVSFFSPGFQAWDFSTLESFSALIPPRWHNTVVQLLASCGCVGLGAYVLHRVQSVRMLLSRRHKEQIFIGCSVLVMIFCSLLDCHFFNLGPTLLYSAALAWAEFVPGKQTVSSLGNQG